MRNQIALNVYVFLFFLIAAAFSTSITATAQTLVEPNTPLVNEYLQDPDSKRSSIWWNALGRQLTLALDVPSEQLTDVALQNIIFFATVRHSEVELRDAVPRLLDVYKSHDREAYRLMALAALDAIGDQRARSAMREVVRSEEPGRVRSTTIAALYRETQRR